MNPPEHPDDRPMRQSDHDLLVTIHTKVERVITDVKDLSTNAVEKITTLEVGKADKSEVEKVKTDIRWLQRIAYSGLGVVGAIEFYFLAIKK